MGGDEMGGRVREDKEILHNEMYQDNLTEMFHGRRTTHFWKSSSTAERYHYENIVKTGIAKLIKHTGSLDIHDTN